MHVFHVPIGFSVRCILFVFGLITAEKTEMHRFQVVSRIAIATDATTAMRRDL